MTASDRHPGQPALVVGGSAARVGSRRSLRRQHLARRSDRRGAPAQRPEPDGADAPESSSTPKSAAPAGPREWHDLSEAERVLAWEQLRGWVAWLVDRYRLTLESRVPPCWAEHPELIEELWALKAWRAEAYGEEPSGQSAVLWHQALIGFLGHVSTFWAAGCRARHRTVPRTVADDEELAARWSAADPLAGVPARMRRDVGERDVDEDVAVTEPQMEALLRAGLAQKVRNTSVPLVVYAQRFWMHSSLATGGAGEESGPESVWLPGDDELASQLADVIVTGPDGVPTAVDADGSEKGNLRHDDP